MNARRLRACRAAIALAIALVACGGAAAAELDPPACRTVRLASPGWADIDATDALLSVTLKALGYRPVVTTLSVPLAYQGLRSGQLDAFLGNWMPAQSALVEPLLRARQVELLGVNLAGARFTLAVPDYVAQAGVHSFADLAARADRFSHRIYGIEAGAPANESIKRMIATDAYGLGRWTLVESSEAALMAQLAHDVQARKDVVFLAWEPHVVNTRFRIAYLAGGEAWFGPDGGAASVRTVARPGYRAQCGNVGRLLAQLAFSVPLENRLIAMSLVDRVPPEQAARRVLKEDPALAAAWLAGVRTADGGDAAAALQKAVGP